MNQRSDPSKGVRVLIFDEGGAGTYSQLLVVKEYMARIAFDKCQDEESLFAADFFDLMGGVGFGGLVALLLGSLRMTVKEVMDAFINIFTEVFTKPSGSLFRITDLKRCIERLLRERDLPLDIDMDSPYLPGNKCNVVTFAATPARVNHHIAFRTYQVPHAEDSCTFVQAVCATMASPALFEPFSFGSGLLDPTYIGPPLTQSNPTKIIIRELQSIYGPKHTVSLILSLGAGRGSVHSLGYEGELPDKMEKLANRIAKDTEGVADDLSHQYIANTGYLRLNVNPGLESIQRADWSQLISINTHTKVYLNKASVSRAINDSVQLLHKNRRGCITIGELNQVS
ncbi:FabD/lysophospholipase-like protein, partial [Serendipita vermifera]